MTPVPCMSTWRPFAEIFIVTSKLVDPAACALLAAARNVLIDTAALPLPLPHAAAAIATATTSPAKLNRPRIVASASGPFTVRERGAPGRAPHSFDQWCRRTLEVAHATHVGHATGHAAGGGSRLGLVGDDGLGGEEQGCDRRRVLQRR